jgi:hypothetical protein
VDDVNEDDQTGTGERDPGSKVLADLGGDEPDGKHATFRLVGVRLDPDAITPATGSTPDPTIRKGDPVLSRGEVVSLRGVGVWWIDSARELPRTNNHLEDHVIWLLDLVEPLADVLRRLSDEESASRPASLDVARPRARACGRRRRNAPRRVGQPRRPGWCVRATRRARWARACHAGRTRPLWEPRSP